MSRRRRFIWSGIAIVLAGVILAVAYQSADDPATQAFGYPIGRTKAEMVRDLGPPDLTRSVDESNRLDPCAKRGAVDVLEYRVPSRGPIAYLNRKLTSAPSQ